MALSKLQINLDNILNPIISPLSEFSEFSIAAGVTLSYFLLYTAYDKTTKSLGTKNLVDLITCGRGLDWTLVEINKG